MLLKYFGFAGEGDIIMMTTQGDTGITMQSSFALEVSQRKRIESLLCLDIPLNLSFSSIVVNRIVFEGTVSFHESRTIIDINHTTTHGNYVPFGDDIEHVPFRLCWHEYCSDI